MRREAVEVGRSSRRRWGVLLRSLALALLLIAGAALRLYDVNWDQFQHVHPDERFIVWVADTVSWPGSLAAALDPERSTINPFRWPPDDPASGTRNSLAGQSRNYAYGHFPLYLLVLTAHVGQDVANWLGENAYAFPGAFQPLHTLGRYLASYHYLPLMGRVISAVADLGTLILVYLLARRLVQDCHPERVYHSEPVVASPQRRISSWKFLGSGSTAQRQSQQAASEASRRDQPDPSPGDATRSLALCRHNGWAVDPLRVTGGTFSSVEQFVVEAIPLLAAAAYAFAVLPIQLSHFVAVDALLTFFVTASVALAAYTAGQAALWANSESANSESANGESAKTHPAPRTPHPAPSRSIPWGRTTQYPWIPWLLAAIMVGLAIGSKFSAVLLALPLVAAALYGLPAGSRWRQAALVVGRLAAAGAIALLVFALTNPFAILEFSVYVRQIIMQNAMVSGTMDAPYTRQYIGTPPYLYFVQQLSQWGLGWPLGLIAWGGLVWATIVFVRRRASPVLTVMLAWALPYFAITGAFQVKFLRYMAPLLPFLLVFGAGAVLAGYRGLARRWGKRGKAAWTSFVIITMIVTIAWVLAFLGVYRQEHPWIQASRWIYQNIPTGSKLLTEHWDDALPLTLDELPGLRPQRREYVRTELPLWDPDNVEKLDLLVAELSSADYIVLASDRLSAPMQRLSIRYPLGSQYYRLLFAGDLGYRPVAEFTAYPRLGPLVIRDDRADESFYVYDHPRVLVLENTERLSAALLRARLGRYLPLGGRPSDSGFSCHPFAALRASSERVNDTASVTKQPQRRVSSTPPRTCCEGKAGSFAGISLQLALSDQPAQDDIPVQGKRVPGLARMLPQAPAPDAPLTLSQPVDTLPVVADFRWNRAASRSVPLAVAIWWLALSLFGWLAWPLLFPLLGGLRDRGYGLARAAGWLLVGWIHWMGVSVGAWENRLAALTIIVGAVALAGIVAAWAQRRQMAAFWAERRRLLLGQEALFAAAFLAFVGVRLLNPDLWQPWNGGEKFMEFAFLNAILRSPSFPPYDPYFAGGIINYYYYGLYLVSLPIKLTGIFPEVAFNLAVPGLFALTAVGVFSVTYTLAAKQTKWESSTKTHEDARSSILSDPSCPSWIENRSQGAAPALTALISVAMALLMGNLRGLKWLGDVYLAVLRGAPLPHYDYWGASRVIPYTINEFPLWTFTFADLHPHMIAMPFGMLVVGLALNWVLGRGQGTGDRGQGTGVGGQGTGDRGQESGIRSQTAGGRLSSIEFLPFPEFPRSLVSPAPHLLVSLSPCLLVSLSLGALGAINTWDLPTYALLVAGVFLVAGWRAQYWRGLARGAAWAVVTVVLAVAAYWPFYANYQAQVGGGEGSLVGRFLAWTRAASSLGDWLSVWGVFLLLALSYLVVVWARGIRKDLDTQSQREPTQQAATSAPDAGTPGLAPVSPPTPQAATSALDAGTPGLAPVSPPTPQAATSAPDAGTPGLAPVSPPTPPTQQAATSGVARGGGGRWWLVGLLALGAVLAVLAAAGRPTAAIAALPLCLALPLIVRRRASAGESFTALLLALGLGIVAGIELVYLRDFLEGGEWYRMNTLFKFSVPAWLLLSTAGGVMLLRAWGAAGKAPAWVGWPWRAGMGALLAGGLVFLVAGIPARVDDRFPGAQPAIGTLDATAYMTVGRYTWPTFDSVIELRPERDAIRWLLSNVDGTPVIAEAPVGWYEVAGTFGGYDYYRAGGLRVASLTGFPTFVGQHQNEQRPGDQVGPRTELGQEFFRTTDITRSRTLIRELRVGYVYIGQLERVLFKPESLAKFDDLVSLGDLAVAYRNEGVIIYRVLPGAE